MQERTKRDSGGSLGAFWGLVGPSLRAQESQRVCTATPKDVKKPLRGGRLTRFCEKYQFKPKSQKCSKTVGFAVFLSSQATQKTFVKHAERHRKRHDDTADDLGRPNMIPIRV